MKELVGFDHALGADGGKVAGGLGVDGANFSANVQLLYPIAKVIEPATNLIDELITKLETIIPGDWDKPLLESVKVEYKAKLVALFSEAPAAPVAPAPAV